MIKSVSLQNFKCFAAKENIALARITIFYGHNGRGKSSLSQALLLVGQSMTERNDLETLSVVGRQVDLGSFSELITADSEDKEIKFWLDTDNENLELGFVAERDKKQSGRLNTFIVNGDNRFNEQSTPSDDVETGLRRVVSSTSDVSVLQQLKDITYISAGRLGPVNDVQRNDSLPSNLIGTKGENLLNALSHQPKEFVDSVARYLSEILGGGALNVREVGSTRLELLLDSHNGDREFLPVNVGFGYSYVLPVIVGALLAEKGSVLIVENPEAHLYPRAQSRIMEFLVNQALAKDLQIIVETHSDHVVNGLRISMKNRVLQPSEGIIQHFGVKDDGISPDITPITCDVNGSLSDYPDDFLDEWTEQMMQLV